MSKKQIGLLLAAIVVLILIVVSSHHSAPGAATNPTCGNNTSCTTGNFYISGQATAQALSALGGSLFLGDSSTTTSAVTEFPTNGSCSTGTTTLFAVQNPFAATSTVVFSQIVGTMGATTSDLFVGTSTRSSMPSSATSTGVLSPSLVAGTIVATSTQFFAIGGVTNKFGPGGGYANNVPSPYSVSSSIVVGPTEYIVGYATSTYLTGLWPSAGVASCTYKILWTN